MPATYETIATTTLTSTATEIVFSSIPGTYTDLRLVAVFTPTASLRPRIDLNSDTGTNYSSTLTTSSGTTASSIQYTNANYWNVANANTVVGGMLEVDFLSYANGQNKTALTRYNNNDNSTNGRLAGGIALYRSTSPITTIRFWVSASTFAAGTIATLYGIKSA